MLSVLGIDAAWTTTQSSGVALVNQVNGGWECKALAPSYESFTSLSKGVAVQWHDKPKGGKPAPAALLRAAETILGTHHQISVIALDMPVATVKITGRREADNAISRKFASKLCATHSPTPTRPGSIGTAFSEGLAEEGYPLATDKSESGRYPRLIEVYPHPALLELMHEEERLCYKVSKSSKYWPEKTVQERIERLINKFDCILKALKKNIRNIELPLPRQSDVRHLSELKRYEDAIDALVCAWVGIQYLLGRAKPFGDDTAAIWIPVTE